MPAPITKGLVGYVAEALGLQVWDGGEIPRRDVNGNTINLELPADLVINCGMSETGLQREWTQADAYEDKGQVILRVWGIQRNTVENELTAIEVLLAPETAWRAVNMGNDPKGRPYELVHCVLQSWTCVQDRYVRTPSSTLVYRGEMRYEVGIHGEVPTGVD